MILADRIRKYVLEQQIEPARARGQTMIVVCAGEIHAALELQNRMPAVCGALDAEKFLDFARVRLIERSGPHQGITAEWVFALD